VAVEAQPASARTAAGGERDPRYPPSPFPIGWFQVGFADQLKAGEVSPFRAMGRDFVLWRGEDGEPHLMDAHCAHLGAHIGHGGVVVGNCIRCPFHAWEYGADGRCVKVPYGSGRIHPDAGVATHPLVERNGMLLMWWHPRGEAPAWEIPELPEYGDPGWTDYEPHEWHIDTHWQEMVENAVDTSHFHYLHGTEVVPTIPEYSFEGHVLHVKADHVFRTPMGPRQGFIDTHMHGPGWGTVRIEITDLVQILFPQALTPVDVGHLHATFSFMTRGRGARSMLGRALSQEIIAQIDADAPIWEAKLYRPLPRLADGDGPVLPFRRWAEQFYVEDGAAAAAANGAG
jgi:nitrite reductase/ring-hydroxylating ferredoxin subunit